MSPGGVRIPRGPQLLLPCGLEFAGLPRLLEPSRPSFGAIVGPKAEAVAGSCAGYLPGSAWMGA